MISGFSIILDDDILYCSNKKKYPSFEIVLFIEKLLRSINPKNTWRLKKICLKGKRIGKERIIVKHILTQENQSLFFCIIGEFPVGSKEAFKMLREFSKQVKFSYKNLLQFKAASKKLNFKDIVNLITNYLKEKYKDPLAEEKIDKNIQYANSNSILYAGVSTQGLPIISQLYDGTLLQNLEKDHTYENIELFTSDLSAKLATIAMNTKIRVKTKIKEIHINNTLDKKNKILIFFGNINGYSIDFVASGNFYKIKNVFHQLRSEVATDQALQNEFTGDLRPYKHIKQYLNDIIRQFDYH
jgi:hypothetical protein